MFVGWKVEATQVVNQSAVSGPDSSSSFQPRQAVYIVRAGSSAAAEAWGTGPEEFPIWEWSAKPIWRCWPTMMIKAKKQT